MSETVTRPGRLAGKSVLITAAAAGIGRATAMAMAAEGADVLATDIDRDGLATLADAGLRTQPLDVTDPGAITGLTGTLDRVDVLVNCAGIVPHGTVMDCDDAALESAYTINVRGMVWMIRAVLPKMLAAGRGSIVNIASVASSITGVPNRFAYGLTKAAIIGLSKSVAADYVRAGIRCNAVCPGTVHTPSWEGRVAAAEDPDQARRDFIARQPMGRIGRADEVAALCVYLGSDESAFTTGAIHVIDGGWTM